MTSRRCAACWLLSLLAFSGAGGCSCSYVTTTREADAGEVDAAAPDRCARDGVALRWASPWESVSGEITTIEADAFYVERAGDLLRLDPSGAWTVEPIERDPSLPAMALLALDGEPWLARWSHSRLVAGPRATSGEGFAVALDVPIAPAVQWIAGLDREHLVAGSDSAGQPASVEVLSRDGRVVRARAPLPVDGGARAAHGPGGQLRVVVENGTGLYAGPADGSALEPLGVVCPRPYACSFDLLPLDATTSVWAWSADDEGFVELRVLGAAPRRAELEAVEIESVSLGAGPDGTLLVGAVRRGALEVRVLDAATLIELGRASIASEPIEGTTFMPPPRGLELGVVSIERTFAVRALFEIPDGTLERFALGEVCAR